MNLRITIKNRTDFWRLPALLIMTMLLVGCQSLSEEANWPEDVPERQQFLAVYQDDVENQQEQTQQQYLNWIVRFYQGWDLMSTGWNELTPAVLMGMSGDTLAAAENESHELGVAISSEWAKVSKKTSFVSVDIDPVSESA